MATTSTVPSTISTPTRPPAVPSPFSINAATTATPTTIDRRPSSTLSLFFRAIKLFMRPLRPKLIGNFEAVWPAGSPRLPKHPTSHKSVTITERVIPIPSMPDHPPLPQIDNDKTGTQNMWLYDLVPARSHQADLRDGAKREVKQTVYYFAGGGFQQPPSAEHWKFCARLARSLAESTHTNTGDVRVVMVSYPLAPNSPAKHALPFLRAWLVHTLREANEDSARGEHNVTLMGDSAGGNVAIVLAFWWAKQVAQMRQSGDVAGLEWMARLKKIIVMSPPCDFRNVNPDIAEADKLDPVLTRGVTDGAADAWCKGWEVAGEDGADAKGDPELSPNLSGEEAWRVLRESGLVLDGLFGTADVLAPDCEVFMRRCEGERIPGKWLVWEGQMHCFPMIVAYGVREGREGFEWVLERVKEVS